MAYFITDTILDADGSSQSCELLWVNDGNKPWNKTHFCNPESISRHGFDEKRDNKRFSNSFEDQQLTENGFQPEYIPYIFEKHLRAPTLNTDVLKINNHPCKIVEQQYPLHIESSWCFMGSRGVTKKSNIYPSFRCHSIIEWITRN